MAPEDPGAYVVTRTASARHRSVAEMPNPACDARAMISSLDSEPVASPASNSSAGPLEGVVSGSGSDSRSGCTCSVTSMNGTTPCSTTSGSPVSRAASTIDAGGAVNVRPSSMTNAATPFAASART